MSFQQHPQLSKYLNIRTFLSTALRATLALLKIVVSAQVVRARSSVNPRRVVCSPGAQLSLAAAISWHAVF